MEDRDIGTTTLAGRVAGRMADVTEADRGRPTQIAAFVSELDITLEPAEPGAWNPFNLRRGEKTIPCEAWTRLDVPPGGATVEAAIQRMAAIHSAGSPARAERMRAVDLLGQEGYDYLVSVIGPEVVAVLAPSVTADVAPGAVVEDPSPPSARPAVGPPSLSPDPAALGETDAVVAAQAVAAVLVSGYRPALYGALTFAAVALSSIPARGFYERLGEDAYGSGWPWRRRKKQAQDRVTYDKAFERFWVSYRGTHDHRAHAMLMREAQVTSDRPLDQDSDELKPASPPSLLTKSPSTDRKAIVTSKQPDVPLEVAAAEADREQLRVTGDAAERERLEIVNRFPIADWPTLPLERYALGLPESADGFCRWMEFNTHYLPSIKGGSALKHMIFKRQTGDWYFEKKYASLDQAWTNVRAGFVEAFRLAGEGRFEDIGQVDGINAAISLSTKAVYCYFPDDLCRSAPERTRSTSGGCSVGKAPSRRASRRPAVSWSSSASGRSSTAGAPARSCGSSTPGRIRGSRSGSSRLRPGTNAALWQDCLDNGYIRVGWDEVGDLREFESRDQFNARFADVFSALYKGNGPKISEKAGEVWMLTELVPGDIVIANQGTSRVVGIGTVTDRGYEKRDQTWTSSRTHVGVAWDPTQARDIDPIKRWAFKTVAKVSQAEYQQILKGRTGTPVRRLRVSRHLWRPSTRSSARSPESWSARGR